MPYKSDAQRKFMHWKHPGIAARWDKEYPNQKGLPERVGKKDSEKKSSNGDSNMTFVENVVDAFQASAAALEQAEKLINEKKASDQVYLDLVPKVVDICAKFGKIDNTEEEKQALAEALQNPAGALDVIAKLASFVDESAGSSIGSQQVDSKGNLVHNSNGHSKKASYSSLESPYVGRRTSDKPQSWVNLERGLGLS